MHPEWINSDFTIRAGQRNVQHEADAEKIATVPAPSKPLENVCHPQMILSEIHGVKVWIPE